MDDLDKLIDESSGVHVEDEAKALNEFLGTQQQLQQLQQQQQQHVAQSHINPHMGIQQPQQQHVGYHPQQQGMNMQQQRVMNTAAGVPQQPPQQHTQMHRAQPQQNITGQYVQQQQQGHPNSMGYHPQQGQQQKPNIIMQPGQVQQQKPMAGVPQQPNMQPMAKGVYQPMVGQPQQNVTQVPNQPMNMQSKQQPGGMMGKPMPQGQPQQPMSKPMPQGQPQNIQQQRPVSVGSPTPITTSTTINAKMPAMPQNVQQQQYTQQQQQQNLQQQRPMVAGQQPQGQQPQYQQQNMQPNVQQPKPMGIQQQGQPQYAQGQPQYAQRPMSQQPNPNIQSIPQQQTIPQQTIPQQNIPQQLIPQQQPQTQQTIPQQQNVAQVNSPNTTTITTPSTPTPGVPGAPTTTPTPTPGAPSAATSGAPGAPPQNPIQSKIQNHFNALALAYRNAIIVKETLMEHLNCLFGPENAKAYALKIDDIPKNKVPPPPKDFDINNVLSKTRDLRQLTIDFQRTTSNASNRAAQPSGGLAVGGAGMGANGGPPTPSQPQTPNTPAVSTPPPSKEDKKAELKKLREKKKKEKEDKKAEEAAAKEEKKKLQQQQQQQAKAEKELEQAENEEDKQNIKDLNDVTKIANIDMKNESDAFLPDSNEDEEMYAAETEPLFLNSYQLRKKINNILQKYGIKSNEENVLEVMSLATQDYLRTVLEYLIKVSQQRSELNKEELPSVVTSDTKKQLMMIEKREREDKIRKETEEHEKLLREVRQQEQLLKKKSDGKENVALREKISKVKQESEERVRTSAANSTALAAIGNIGKKKVLHSMIGKPPALAAPPPIAPLSNPQLVLLQGMVKEGKTLTPEQQTQLSTLSQSHEAALKQYNEKLAAYKTSAAAAAAAASADSMDTSADTPTPTPTTANGTPGTITPNPTSTISTPTLSLPPTITTTTASSTTNSNTLASTQSPTLRPMGTFLSSSTLGAKQRKIVKKDCYFAQKMIGYNILQKYELLKLKKRFNPSVFPM
ncbi:hypothetical protein CYY_004720 [Polysphondylium violaceum]|uniref:Transcription initiation factor TFIID component TAF4 C-terminal domain-containing protein n=1 Tax=Polysphondylium violaceum TaxID=133409 RepID=A0A8J4PUU8_9MYCE|nr:hypothetical protein CYY_004720 [Polysphondylium violaceum]